MRFMIIVRATAHSEAEPMPGEELLAAMVSYHEDPAQILRSARRRRSRTMKEFLILPALSQVAI